MNDAIHMTVSDSKTMEVNVLPAGGAITVGALFAYPTENVPPERGEKYPLVKELRFVMDAMPADPDVVDANSPPSGEIARQRREPYTASDGGVCGMEEAP